MANFAAIQKELMIKLKPKVEDDAEKSEEADNSKDNKDMNEEKESPNNSPEPAASPLSKQTHDKDEADGDGFNFDSVTSDKRLSTTAAHHKIGVVRNAKQRKRQKPARIRSVNSLEPSIDSDGADEIEGAKAIEETPKNEEARTVKKKEEDKATKKDDGIELMKSEGTSELLSTSPAKSSQLLLGSPTIEKTTPISEEEGKSTKNDETSEQKTKEVEKSLELSKGAPEIEKKPATRYTVAATEGTASSPSSGTSIFTSSSAARPNQLGTSSSNSAILAIGAMAMSPLIVDISPTNKTSPDEAAKKSPTSPGTVEVSVTKKTSPISETSSNSSKESGYVGTRRRSSTRDLARIFEASGNGESNKSQPAENKPSYRKSVSCEDAALASAQKESTVTKNIVKSEATTYRSVTSKVSSPPVVQKSPEATSPRKLSHPVFPNTSTKASPLQRKVSEPGLKPATQNPSPIVSSRLSRLTESSTSSKENQRSNPDATRIRSKTTSSISERTSAFQEGSKSTTATSSIQVRKLSNNVGDRQRSRVMDMKKKFEALS